MVLIFFNEYYFGVSFPLSAAAHAAQPMLQYCCKPVFVKHLR